MRRVCTEETWLERVLKIFEGFSKHVFVYSRFDFIVDVVNNIRTVAAGCLARLAFFIPYFKHNGCIKILIYNCKNELHKIY